MFISIRSQHFLNHCLCNGSTSFKPFELCSLEDDTFEKLMMINHHNKSVNNFKIADQDTRRDNIMYFLVNVSPKPLDIAPSNFADA